MHLDVILLEDGEKEQVYTKYTCFFFFFWHRDL
jgi:hypothetical protein